METVGLARRSVLLVAVLVLIGAVVALAAPGLRGATGRRSPAGVAGAALTTTTTLLPAGTLPASTQVSTPVPTTPPASSASGSITSVSGASVASGASRQLAQTGLSPWWVLGGAGVTYLGLLVLWAEAHLRPEASLRPWWGPYRPRHRRTRR